MTRPRIITLTVAILAAGFIIYLCVPKEPRYQGRKLSEWLYQASAAHNNSPSNAGSDPQWQSASNAIVHIGTNALPLLLNWISTKDSKPKAAINSWLNSHPWLHFHIRSDRVRQETALTGFLLLRDKSKPAWPALVQMTYDKEPTRRSFGLLSLFFAKADKDTVLPVCLRLIKDPDKNVQGAMVYWFHYFYPKDAEAAGVYQLEPQLTNQPTILTDTSQPLLK